MKSLRCIVADDEPLALKLIESYIAKTEGLELAGGFSSATDALAAVCRADADIAFLDIQMPRMSGLEIARAARESGTKVVFVTAYRDYAVEGFRVNALDYLLKPVSYDEFLEAVERARDIVPNDEQACEPACMMVRSDYRQVRVNFDDITYIEGLKDYVKIHTDSRERPLLTQMSLKAVEQALPPAKFMRVHRSFILAVDRIASFDRSAVTLAQGTSIPVGDTYRSQFLQRMGQQI